jgi:hypothetical protein
MRGKKDDETRRRTKGRNNSSREEGIPCSFMFVTIFHYLKAVIAFYTGTRKLWGAIYAY